MALVTETGGDGADDPGAVRDLHTAAGGNVRDLEGAYGRALALRSEYPNDPQVTATIELLARALSQAQRGVGA